PLDAALTHVVKAAGARGEALPDVDSARLKVTAGQTDRVGGSCRGFTHAARPDVLLDVARPMTDVWYRATTNPALRVVLEGPFGDDGREVEAEYTWRCLAGGDQPRAAFPRLEMGRYRVYFAFPDKAESDDVAFVLGTEKSPERPLERLREPAASLAVTDKRLLPYYPMLPMDSNAWLRLEDLHPDERQALFLDAPRSLFAYPKFDLDKATAQLSGIDPRKLEELGVEIAWPKTDEPLLVVRQDRDRVVALTADATVVVVEAKYLVAAPAGAPVVPTEMRNRILTWDDVVRWAADEDRKEIDAVDKANDKAEACYSDYWDAHHGGVSGRLSLITYVNGRVASVRDYTAMVKDAAGKKCGLAAVEKKKEKAFGKLDARFRKRGAEALTQIAARFAAP
ncbi:MAG: hypothetical protein KC635_29110, partial [Myxococcales bacterium]|nr:hypothetical protein [Myxococcales bacterium]